MRVIVLAETATEAQLATLQPASFSNITPEPVFVYRSFQKMEGHKMYEDDLYHVVFDINHEAARKCVDYLVRTATVYNLILEVLDINTYRAVRSPRRYRGGVV